MYPRHPMSYNFRMDTAQYSSVQKRHQRLIQVLPLPGTGPTQCLSTPQLLELLGESYGNQGDAARLRTLQRDLEKLVASEAIEVVNPGGKPLLFRQRRSSLLDDQTIWRFTVQQIEDLARGVITSKQWDTFADSLLHHKDGPILDRSRFRILPDSLRLSPAAVKPKVLSAVIQALARGRVLKVHYENVRGQRSKVKIHPQALLQRGPVPYLFALKNDEDEPLRLYALQRMISAEVLVDDAARQVPDFDLDRAIAEGMADFGHGTQVALELRVRGYLVNLLIDCPLSKGQTWEEEPPGSDFDIRVSAQVPETGQLLRWLLGAGANVEVIAPEELRRVVADQAAKMAALYPDSPEPGSDSTSSKPAHPGHE